MNKARAAALLALLQTSCQSPPDIAELQARLEARVAALEGDVGLYMQHLEHHQSIAINADTVFPTASMIKVPILAVLLDKVERGQLNYHDTLKYTKERRRAGDDLLSSFADGEELTLDRLAFLMITTSDNTAAIWCQELAGTGSAINEWLRDHGFVHTRVNSRTPGREAARERYGWGQTTPREMAQMLVCVRDRALVSTAVDEEIARAMGRIYWDGEALASIPTAVATMSKQGAINASRSEVVLVHAPHGDYVFCLITNHQRDQSWGHSNPGFALLRDVSRIIWDHYEQGWPRPPAAEHARFR